MTSVGRKNRYYHTGTWTYTYSLLGHLREKYRGVNDPFRTFTSPYVLYERRYYHLFVRRWIGVACESEY